MQKIIEKGFTSILKEKFKVKREAHSIGNYYELHVKTPFNNNIIGNVPKFSVWYIVNRVDLKEYIEDRISEIPIYPFLARNCARYFDDWNRDFKRNGEFDKYEIVERGILLFPDDCDLFLFHF